jgi:septum formation protein
VTQAAPAEARRDAEPASAPRLILASRSPQRRAILDQLRVEYSVTAPEVEERVEGEPREVAIENARRKAQAVSAPAGAAVLGVDTVVCLGRRIYEKPRNPDEARATLAALSGRTHIVISGVCLLADGRARTGAARTEVEFRQLEGFMIDWYVAGGEWAERAGGYAIQGRGAALVKRISGDYLNVVGLPVSLLLDLAPWLLRRGCG